MSISSTKVQSKSESIADNTYLYFALLWIVGIGLRLTILAPPPVISLIYTDLNMSETQVGLLSGIPTALFACAAILGAMLIVRFGAFTAVIIGLLTTAVGSALRGAAPNVTLLFLATVLTGLGVAIMQPSMPSLVRLWLPNHIRLATAIYTNGLLIGEVLPISLTLSLILPLVGSWRLDFVFWGAACALIALVVFILAPKLTASESKTTLPRKWWPNWRSKLIWKLGIMMGSMNAVYFSANFFIPRYLQVIGHGADVGSALIALNVGQLPASIFLLFISRRLEQHTWPYIGCGVLCLISILSIIYGNSLFITTGAFLLGFAASVILVLMLALPALLSPPEDVHRTATAMLTIGYSCAVIVPIVSGFLWDITGIPAVTFIPIALCALILIMTAAVTPIEQS